MDGVGTQARFREDLELAFRLDLIAIRLMLWLELEVLVG